jgi:hypothetical protein
MSYSVGELEATSFILPEPQEATLVIVLEPEHIIYLAGA